MTSQLVDWKALDLIFLLKPASLIGNTVTEVGLIVSRGQ